jgi:hypothetical protein
VCVRVCVRMTWTGAASHMCWTDLASHVGCACHLTKGLFDVMNGLFDVFCACGIDADDAAVFVCVCVCVCRAYRAYGYEIKDLCVLPCP